MGSVEGKATDVRPISPIRKATVVAAIGFVTISAYCANVLAFASPYWVGQTVPFPSWSSTAPPNPTCYYVNSSSVDDLFCLTYFFGVDVWSLNISFGHGDGTGSATTVISGGPDCIGCPTDADWISPDGTGRVLWSGGSQLTLEARN